MKLNKFKQLFEKISGINMPQEIIDSYKSNLRDQNFGEPQNEYQMQILKEYGDAFGHAGASGYAKATQFIIQGLPQGTVVLLRENKSKWKIGRVFGKITQKQAKNLHLPSSDFFLNTKCGPVHPGSMEDWLEHTNFVVSSHERLKLAKEAEITDKIIAEKWTIGGMTPTCTAQFQPGSVFSDDLYHPSFYLK